MIDAQATASLPGRASPEARREGRSSGLTALNRRSSGRVPPAPGHTSGGQTCHVLVRPRCDDAPGPGGRKLAAPRPPLFLRDPGMEIPNGASCGAPDCELPVKVDPVRWLRPVTGDPRDLPRSMR
jgi:hypothetical protein